MCFFFTRRVFIIEFQRDETGGLDSGMLLAGGIWWENVVFQPDCVPGKWVSKTQRKLPHPGMFTSDRETSSVAQGSDYEKKSDLGHDRCGKEVGPVRPGNIPVVKLVPT